MVWESDPWPQIILGNSSIVSLQFFKQAMNKVINDRVNHEIPDLLKYLPLLSSPFLFLSLLKMSYWKCKGKNWELCVWEESQKPWDASIRLEGLYLVSSPFYSDSGRDRWTGSGGKIPGRPCHCPSSRKCSQKRSSEGRRREDGGERDTAQLRAAGGGLSGPPAPAGGAEQVSPARPVRPAACSAGHSLPPRAAPQLKMGVKRNYSPECSWGPNGLTEKALREGPSTQ